MSDSDYHFVSRWRVEGTCGEVADVLGDPLSFPRWWPSVYLAVEELRPADARGLGRTARLHTRGWLPYTLLWQSEIVETRYPYGFTIVATGDFDGRGEWTFEQDGDVVDITYDWRLRAEKPLIKQLTFLLRPVFESNHKWAMTQGETSLRLELERRRATSEAFRAQIPPPPGPISYGAVAIVAGAVGVGASLAYLIARRRRSTSAAGSSR
jgi:hypothetical protein